MVVGYVLDHLTEWVMKLIKIWLDIQEKRRQNQKIHDDQMAAETEEERRKALEEAAKHLGNSNP